MNKQFLLNESQVAEHFGISVMTLRKFRSSGGGPKYVKIGASVRYKPADLEEYVDTNTRQTTSEASA